MDPRKTVFHEAAQACDALERLNAKRAKAKAKQDLAFSKRWDEKKQAIWDGLSPDAKEMVKSKDHDTN